MKNIPQKIYLQIGQGNEDEPDFSSFSEVTWSAERVFGNDIEFVLQQTPVSGSLPQFTANDVDGAYFLGVFNIGGIDGLADELKRIKELGFMPHQLMHMLKVGGNDR